MPRRNARKAASRFIAKLFLEEVSPETSKSRERGQILKPGPEARVEVSTSTSSPLAHLCSLADSTGVVTWPLAGGSVSLFLLTSFRVVSTSDLETGDRLSGFSSRAR